MFGTDLRVRSDLRSLLVVRMHLAWPSCARQTAWRDCLETLKIAMGVFSCVETRRRRGWHQPDSHAHTLIAAAFASAVSPTPGTLVLMDSDVPNRAINLADKLSQFDDHWSPRTVAEFNGHDVMVVKVKGEFVWHHHDDTDDLFLVLSGRVTIRLRDGDVDLGPGEMFVVPVGVEHQPYAAEEAELLLIEPSGTPNTGDEATAAQRIAI